MPRELGSVTRCVSDLWQLRGSVLGPNAIRFRRLTLWQAVATEMEWRLQHQATDYDPDRDHRVIWARQFLEVQEGDRRLVDPDVEATAETLISRHTFVPSGKDRATGDS